MNKSLFFLILISAISCTGWDQKARAKDSVHANETGDSSNHVNFSFSAEQAGTHNKTITIRATLFNHDDDTLCFLSSSCDGEQYSLRYDMSELELAPRRLCNANFPVLLKIAPGKHHDFTAHFNVNSNDTSIRLGFDLYQVDPFFDLSELALKDIHNRKEQNIIWANEVRIKPENWKH